MRLALVTMLLVACAPKSNSTMTMAEYVAKHERAACNRRVTCGLVSAAEVDACADHYTGTVHKLAQTNAVVDEASALDCLRSIPSADCGQFLGLQEFFCAPKIVSIGLPQGSACTRYSRCAEGLACQAASCGSTCQPAPAIGEACTFDCAKGAFCDANVCKKQHAVGEACGTCTLPACNDCVAGSSCLRGTCRQRQPLGASCAEFPCAEGVCDTTLLVCREVDHHVALGGQCTNSTLTCDEGRCEGLALAKNNAPGQAGTCRKTQLGGPCLTPVDCPTGSSCMNQLCVAGSEGSACTTDRECPVDLGFECSNLGSTPTCRRRPPLGSMCTPFNVLNATAPKCLSGVCASLDGGEGRCEALHDVGAPCPCKWPLACVAGQCVPAGRSGQPCLGTKCLDGACTAPDGGTLFVESGMRCGPKREAGVACFVDDACVSGLCDGTCAPACL